MADKPAQLPMVPKALRGVAHALIVAAVSCAIVVALIWCSLLLVDDMVGAWAIRSVVIIAGIFVAADRLRSTNRRMRVELAPEIGLLILVLLIVSAPPSLLFLALYGSNFRYIAIITTLLISVIASLAYFQKRRDRFPSAADKCTYFGFSWITPPTIIAFVIPQTSI